MSKTIATFIDIKRKIIQNIDHSRNTILVSVAWFTCKDLLGNLINKLDKGCKVEIIISDNIQNKRLSFDKFIEKGGYIYVVPTESGKFLHEKYAIFDNSKLIAGSYNWTVSAESFNHEFIIESKKETLIKQFNIRFNKIKDIAIEYDKSKLINNDRVNTESEDKNFIKLEEELEIEFFEALKVANKLGAKINSERVIIFIQNYGAIGGATKLINVEADKIQSGLIKLGEINRLDLSIEHIILKEKYKSLFNTKTLEIAKKRLDKFK